MSKITKKFLRNRYVRPMGLKDQPENVELNDIFCYRLTADCLRYYCTLIASINSDITPSDDKQGGLCLNHSLGLSELFSWCFEAFSPRRKGLDVRSIKCANKHFLFEEDSGFQSY
jgi:hypothetical protein